MSIWDNKELLTKLEEQRDKLRSTGKRLTFDCYNLKYRDKRAYCSKGLYLGQARDGSLGIVTVLRGVLSGTCKDCAWFSTEEQI